MLSLSQSTLNLYRECPRCFWLKFRKNIKRPRGIFPSLPGGIDLVLKAYFNEYRIKGEIPLLIKGKIEGKLAKVPLNYKFIDWENEIQITGKLDDCIELKEGIYVPLDHKTRSSQPKNIKYSYNYYKVQMDTYALLLVKNGLKIENIAYIIYYSPLRGELHKGFPFEVSVHKLKTDPDAAYRLFIKAKKCIEGPLPEPNPQCEFCRWSKETTKF